MIRRRLEALIAFFQGLLEHAAVEGQLGDEELEPADFGFEFGYAELFTRYRVLLEGFPAVVGRGPDAGLAAGVVDIQAGIEVGLEVAEDRRDLVRPGSFSHGSLPGSLPVVRFPLWLDQDLGGRPPHVFSSLFCSGFWLATPIIKTIGDEYTGAPFVIHGS